MDRLEQEVITAGIGVSQSQVVSTFLATNQLPSIQCSEVVRIISHVSIDMYKKDMILAFYPYISDKENFDSVVLNGGISSLYHDEIKRQV